jgi:hypothetical protein
MHSRYHGLYFEDFLLIKHLFLIITYKKVHIRDIYMAIYIERDNTLLNISVRLINTYMYGYVYDYNYF